MRLVWCLPFVLCACINPNPGSGGPSNSALDALMQGIQAIPNALFGPPPDDPRLDAWFSPPEKALIVGARAQFQTIQTPSDLQLALVAAVAAARTMNDVAQQQPFNGWEEAIVEADFGWMRRLHPTLEVGLCCEATAVGVSMSMEPWLEKATSTQGTDDDDYLLLLKRAYGEPTRGYGAAWHTGGEGDFFCSLFGTGMHLSMLQTIQKQLKSNSIFQQELLEIRQELLADIFERKSIFPYCGGVDGEPTPEAQLQAEADAILQTIELSRTEASRIKARKREHFVRKDL